MNTIYFCIDVKSTGGCYHFLGYYPLFHLLTGQTLAWPEHQAWDTILCVFFSLPVRRSAKKYNARV